MKKSRSFNRFVTAASVTMVIGLFSLFEPAVAGNTSTGDDWQFKAEAYGWLPDIEATTPGGEDIEIPIDDILDNLEFTFMGGLLASKGRWSFLSDVVYLKLSADEGGTKLVNPGPGNSLVIPTKVDIGVEMENWIVNLAGSYSVYQTDTHDVQILAGLRYFWLELTGELDTSVIPVDGILVEGDDDVWDVVAGVRGKSQLSDQWWFNYRFDIGTGESDQTWNAVAQLGYQRDWGSVVLGYRYLHYDFDSDFKLLKDTDVHGPLIGVLWEF